MLNQTRVSRPCAKVFNPRRQERVAKRGRISGFSAASRRRALEHLENSDCYRFAVTLTFPMIVDDDRVAWKLGGRFSTWLRGRAISCFTKREFCESGRPHLHVFTTGSIPIKELQRKWSAICAADRPAQVTQVPIFDYSRACRYLLKKVGDAQNQVPPGYKATGRFWSRKGPMAKTAVLHEAEGAAAVRIIKKLDKARARRAGAKYKPQRDNGVAGRLYRHVGGERVAVCVRRVVDEKVVG